MSIEQHFPTPLLPQGLATPSTTGVDLTALGISNPVPYCAVYWLCHGINIGAYHSNGQNSVFLNYLSLTLSPHPTGVAGIPVQSLLGPLCRDQVSSINTALGNPLPSLVSPSLSPESSIDPTHRGLQGSHLGNWVEAGMEGKGVCLTSLPRSATPTLL